MENTDFADESRVLEILQSGAADRAILYFALGLSETQSTSFFNSDWCFKLNVSSAKLDIRHFSLVDQFEAGSHVRYRALLLLDCICSQLSHGAGRSAALALLRSGTDFDCFSCADKSLGVALRNPFFHCCAEDVHNRTGALIASESELKNCSQLLRILRISYARMVNIADAMDGVRDSGLWFVKQESYPSDMDDGTTINVSFMLRHTSIENDPEIIIAIEHTIVEVDKSVADELARELNCDSYVEREEIEELGATSFEDVDPSAVMLRVAKNDGCDEVQFNLASLTLDAVKEGFALCFPHCNITTDIWCLINGATERLGEGDTSAVKNYVEKCAQCALPAVFVHILTPSEVSVVVDHRKPMHLFCRPQHLVANAIFEKVCQRLEEDGRSVDQYRRLQYVIFVPKFNSLKQQTKERIEACAELVRDGEDSSSLVELYPLTAASISRMEALENEILNASNSDVLYVLIVDECHYAPSQTAVPILHRADIQRRSNFVALMVSATPYSCLSDKSRVPRENIIEWSQNVDKNDRPNYIGFEHYFRSATFRLSSDEFCLRIDDVPVSFSLPQCREFADFETLAEVITLRLKEINLLSGSTLRCAFTFSRFSFIFKRQGKAHTVCIAQNPFIKSLGFAKEILFRGTMGSERAPNLPSVNNNVSVSSQHMRQDKHFSVLYSSIVAACPSLERISPKALPLGSPGPRAEICPGLDSPPLKNKLMADKNGFTIIIDYIFSLAYYGSCRVMHQPTEDASTTFTLLPLQDVVPEVTDETCYTFLKLLHDSCYFDAVSDVSCDITRAVKEALDVLCDSAKGENPGLMGTVECMKHILKSKMTDERNHVRSSEDESWFTETDRIVLMLLTEREPAPMVLMRVFDKDENRSMQTILRHAMNVCGLVRQRTGRCEVPAFSVITDISETSLLREIEPFYRDEFNVGTAEAPMHVRDIIALRKQTKSDTDGHAKVPNLDLKYEDLLNVPCLIILCEKGRMGDTFPHTLRALDLRLRTGGTASCFLQEIGRMCRYPSTKNGAVVPVKDLDAFFAQNNAKFGWTVSIPSSNAFLGIAQNARVVRRILNGLGPARELSDVHLAHLVHPLPYALIDPKVMGAIRRAINKRETDISGDPLSFFAEQGAPQSRYEAERRRSERKIIQFLKMPRGVDDYLCCQTMKDPLTYKLLKSKGHYDFANVDPANQRHDRRFLLSAECQVGKTGAYLHLLTMLRHAIEKGGELLPTVPVAPAIPVGSLWCRWLIPSEANLRQQQPMQYDFPKTGKYHDCIAQQRIAQLKMLLADSHNAVPLHERFIECIKEYEQVVTSAGIARLWALSNIGDYDDVDYRHYINWDNRFIRDGRWHDILGEARSLQSLREEFVENQTIPLAQDVMFGLGTNAQIWDAVDADMDASTPPHANFGAVCKPVCADASAARSFNNIAKSVIVYQLSPRIVPLNDSVIVTLDNFFKNTTIGPRHRVGLQSPTHLITLSVPRKAFRLSPGLGCSFPFQSGPELHAFLQQPKTIKNWIFTPSFCGTDVGPEEKLLMRDDAFCVDGKPLERWIDYGEVLVVRANQLEMYQQFYGGTHIIAALPETMQFVDSDGVEGPLMEAAKHGCGYSRRFSQLLAQYMRWDSIWMIDDYVLKCWKLVCKDLVCNKNNVTLEPATFAEVMLHIESMFFSNLVASTYPNLSDQVAKLIESEFDPRMATSSRMRGLADVTGVMQDKYGVIGMCRGRQWRSNIAHPIKRSYSVYSFFLLNVKATVGKGLYFPARPIWEDIEFNNLLDENNLLVCKLQVFAHEKLSHAAAMLTPLEPEQVADHEKLLNWLEDDGFLLSTERKEMLMSHPQVDSFLVTVDDCIQPMATQQRPQQACFLSLVHNPSSFQRGGLTGFTRSACTLQTCVDNILNESSMLELAMANVAIGDADTATWLMIFPITSAITELDAQLRVDKISHCDLCVSYERLDPSGSVFVDMGDAFAVVCATIQKLSEYEENVCVAPIVLETQAMEIDTREDPSEPSAPVSSTDARDSVSSKRKRASTAGSSPRKKTVKTQDQYIYNVAPKLLEEYESCVADPKRTKKIKDVKEDIFAIHVVAVNKIGPKSNFDSNSLHKRCKELLKRKPAQQQGEFQGPDFPDQEMGEQQTLEAEAGLDRTESIGEDEDAIYGKEDRVGVNASLQSGDNNVTTSKLEDDSV